MEMKFWKKFQVFLWLRPIDWVIKRQISCPSGPLIAGFPNWKMLESRFSSRKLCFLLENMNGKFRKKFRSFLSAVFIYDINFKIFHWNHNKWKNNTEIVKLWNFRGQNYTILMLHEKSANVGMFGISPTTTLGRLPFWNRKFFFVTLRFTHKSSLCYTKNTIHDYYLLYVQAHQWFGDVFSPTFHFHASLYHGSSF